MATYLLYATKPTDCLAIAAATTILGRTATDGVAITAVYYDGDPNDIYQAVQREAPEAQFLIVQVTNRIAWRCNGQLAAVCNVIVDTA